MTPPSPALVAGCALYRFGAGRPILCVPGFADVVATFLPLAGALAARGYEVAVVELPGFGAAPRPTEPVAIAGLAARVAAIARETWQQPVALAGHSIGSTIGVRAAQLLGDACAAYVSLEGNLTEDDAYYSGRAATYADAARFKADHCVTVAAAVAAGTNPVSYALGLPFADPTAMWQLGRDAVAQGATFGPEFRALAIPKRYLWAASTTSAATQAYLRAHAIPNVQLAIEHHSPWVIDAPAIAAEIAAVVESSV